MKRRLHRRWMGALAVFTLGVTLLFGLFAMAFVYTVEDRFLDRLLLQEAARQQAHWQAEGRWRAPVADGVSLVTSVDALPADLAPTMRAEPTRREVPGTEGRHYHLLPLQAAAGPPWLVTEVSQQLIVRPMRDELLAWLAGWGLATLATALLLAWWLARRVTAPLETLARRVTAAEPGRLPDGVAQGLGDDEVGAVGRAFDSLLARTRAFVEREQAFTRDASHELRTPLAVLRLSIERLQADVGTPEPLRHPLAGMHAATLLMEQTVQTLLLMARERTDAAPPPEPVALLPLAEHWVLAHADWLGRQPLRLELALGRHDRLALPAPVLQLVLASLLANAFAHGTAGGAVRIDCSDGALCVSNPSTEPPPADATEPYAKGAQSTGFGLGLSILQRLLAAHGAQLALVHREGVTRAEVRAGSPPSQPPSLSPSPRPSPPAS